MGLKRTVAPSELPIDVVELRDHLRLDVTTEDALLLVYIESATKWIESFTDRQLVTATWQWTRDRFEDEMWVPKPPLQSVTSIQYVDTDGNTQTLATSVYRVIGTISPGEDSETQGRIVRAFQQTWPGVRDQADAITVTFVAGYGNRGQIPDIFRVACMLLATHFYEHRIGVSDVQMQEIPLGIRDLLWPHRVMQFAHR